MLVLASRWSAVWTAPSEPWRSWTRGPTGRATRAAGRSLRVASERCRTPCYAWTARPPSAASARRVAIDGVGVRWTGGNSNVVEAVVSALRRKIGDRAGALETVRGVAAALARSAEPRERLRAWQAHVTSGKAGQDGPPGDEPPDRLQQHEPPLVAEKGRCGQT